MNNMKTYAETLLDLVENCKDECYPSNLDMRNIDFSSANSYSDAIKLVIKELDNQQTSDLPF